MTDIVERLYEMADDTTHELAAEEITRLRAEIERLRAERDAARREGIEAAAEIAKQFAIHQGDAYDIVAAIRTKLLTEGGR